MSLNPVPSVAVQSAQHVNDLSQLTPIERATAEDIIARMARGINEDANFTPDEKLRIIAIQTRTIYQAAMARRFLDRPANIRTGGVTIQTTPPETLYNRGLHGAAFGAGTSLSMAVAPCIFDCVAETFDGALKIARQCVIL